jgi:hypothetical protein
MTRLTHTALPPVPPAPGADRRLDVLLAEYCAIRDEVVHALQAQQSVLNFGASTLSVLLVAAGVVQEVVAQVVVLCAVVPLAAVLVITLWSCELVRMRRAGTYLLALEQEINAVVAQQDALQWEQRVNPTNRLDRTLPGIDGLQRKVVAATFVILAASSSVVGILYSWRSLEAPLSLDLWAPLLAGLLAVVTGLLVVMMFARALGDLSHLHRMQGSRTARFGSIAPSQREPS